MALPVLFTALRILGAVRTVSTLLEMVNGPEPRTLPTGNSNAPIRPDHHDYIIKQYIQTVEWNAAHNIELHITNGSLADGLNRELGLNRPWQEYQSVWSNLKTAGAIDERS